MTMIEENSKHDGQCLCAAPDCLECLAVKLRPPNIVPDDYIEPLMNAIGGQLLETPYSRFGNPTQAQIESIENILLALDAPEAILQFKSGENMLISRWRLGQIVRANPRLVPVGYSKFMGREHSQ
ncbi:MAG: hypothetical protein KAJ07_04575 [Planctomycetes bacterium]|nr:hypothetical protein [Planctomycetota bacterium]